MLDAGIGATHVNLVLTSLNIPAVSEKTLKSREREIGPAIEQVAKTSCNESLCSEKENWNKNTASGESINIAASYDMGWQKRGKGHNSLTGNQVF